MIFFGLVITVCGFLISLLSLGFAGMGVRLTMIFAGNALSLGGIIGVLNRAYVKKAIWRNKA